MTGRVRAAKVRFTIIIQGKEGCCEIRTPCFGVLMNLHKTCPKNWCNHLYHLHLSNSAEVKLTRLELRVLWNAKDIHSTFTYLGYPSCSHALDLGHNIFSFASWLKNSTSVFSGISQWLHYFHFFLSVH